MTMNVFASDNLQASTGGTWLQSPLTRIVCDGVGIDTRQSLENKVFFAIGGLNHDGHDYLREAIAAGAKVLVVHREIRDMPGDVGVLLVDDTRVALGKLAAAYRQSMTQTTVIAITGSAGKTTTKSMVHAVLTSTMKGTCANKSFNNDIGVPMTILSASPTDEYLILELGTNAPGEIAALACIAQPDVAVITMVGRSHLAGLGSVAAVAEEKAAILKYMRPSGTAIINSDAKELQRHIPEHAVTFGEGGGAALRWTDRGCSDGGYWFEINGTARFELGLPGKHNAINAIAAVAVGRSLGINDATISAALAAVKPGDMRFVPQQWRDMTVYNDAYNANPDSMIASLDTFADLTEHADRRVIILGEMGELGSDAAALHQEVGRHLARVHQRCPIAQAIFVGPLTHDIASEFDGPNIHIPKLTDEAIADIHTMLRPGDCVLLKASRSAALERIVTPAPSLTSNT